MNVRLKYVGKHPLRFGDQLLETGDVVNVLPAVAEDLLAEDFQHASAPKPSKKRAKKTTKRNGKR